MSEQHDTIETRVITVSREALRADLAELELRITKVISEGLARKVDVSHVASLEGRLVQVEREVVRRDGPDMVRLNEMGKMVADIKGVIDSRTGSIETIPRLQRELEDLEGRVYSDAELRQLVRQERSGWQGMQWTWWGRVSSVALFIIMMVGFYLTWRYGTNGG